MPVKLDLKRVQPIYQNAISQLIEQMGKPVRLVMSEKTEEDPRIPEWEKQESIKEYKQIKALIDYTVSDYKKYTGEISVPQGMLQMKTYIEDLVLLQKCLWVEPSVESQEYIFSKYRLSRQPIPVGLGKEVFALTFWERITG